MDMQWVLWCVPVTGMCFALAGESVVGSTVACYVLCWSIEVMEGIPFVQSFESIVRNLSQSN